MANYNAIQIGVLIRAFYKSGTAEQIAERTGYNINTVYRYIRTWHDQKIIFVTDWRKNCYNKRHLPVWELRSCDSQHDAPKPKPMTSKERAAQYHQRKAERMARDMLSHMLAAA